MNIGMFPKWCIVAFKVVAGVYLILNVLAIANNVNQETYECWTGVLMLVTVVINCGYCLITFIFAFIILPKADANNPENRNIKTEIPQKDEEEAAADVPVEDDEHQILVDTQPDVDEEAEAAEVENKVSVEAQAKDNTLL
eukprot:UN12543